MDDVRGPVNQSASSIIHNNTGESIEALDKFWGRYAKDEDGGWLSDLAGSGRHMAAALEKFADAIDDAINKLWTQIGIDAAVIAGGVALAFFTAGLASGAAVAAADLVIEFGAGLGVAVSTTIAEIAAGTLVAAAHLAHPGGTPAEHEPPAGLIRAMGVFFDLFVEPRIDHMQDGDQELLGEIDALLAELAPLADDPGASVLRDRVAEFRESWFE
ncbi:hypothetical protein ACN6K3_006163 [Streptomyces sp. SAS_260]